MLSARRAYPGTQNGSGMAKKIGPCARFSRDRLRQGKTIDRVIASTR